MSEQRSYILSYQEAQLPSLAALLAPHLLPGDILCLSGDLGAGKTTFCQHLLKALGCKDDVTSPTFSLLHLYESQLGPVWHFDLYRLEHVDELEELGWHEAQSHLCLVEWPNKLGPYLPHNRLDITITHIDAQTRQLTFIPHGHLCERHTLWKEIERWSTIF